MGKNSYCESYRLEELLEPSKANEKFIEFLNMIFRKMGYSMTIYCVDEMGKRKLIAEWEELKND